MPQVAIYLPDRGHPAYGTVRVIVTDESDEAYELTYLDSDGSVDSAEPGRAPRHAGAPARARAAPHRDGLGWSGAGRRLARCAGRCRLVRGLRGHRPGLRRP